jgi:hypothetical protein
MSIVRALSASFLALTAACVLAQAADADPMLRSDENLGAANVQFAGTCAFQRFCTEPSRGLPEGEVLWGCEGRGSCDDRELWIASPRNGGLGLSQSGLCGKMVQVCKGALCVRARVRDRGHSENRFELSSGAMDALKIKHAMTATCSGYGSESLVLTLQ